MCNGSLHFQLICKDLALSSIVSNLNIMAKVYASGVSDDVLSFKENGLQSFSKEDMDRFFSILEGMTKALAEVKEKNPPAPVEEKEQESLIQRWSDNQLRDMFVGKLVTADDIDTVVNTLTLVCALILTIPYGVMTAADPDYWQSVREVLAACPVQKFTYEEDFQLFSGGFNTVVYSNICVLIMAVMYYLLRPKDDTKFRKWWKSARYVIIMMMMGTVCSIVCLVIISTWLFSWYLIPWSKWCTYSAKSSTISGVAAIVCCAFTGLYFML